MFWIYVPPVIFIAALVALVVILGKKTARLKKEGSFSRKQDQFKTESKNAERFKKAWKLFLGFLEWLIHFIKIGIKKSEAGLSGALHKLKEKRLGRKIPKALPDEDQGMLGDRESNLGIVEKIGRKRETHEEIAFGKTGSSQSEVVVKKKEEPVPQRVMPEIAPEDKVKEEALIHRIAENPKDVEAYRELGDYYLSTGNIKDAKDSFKMVLKLRPRDLKAKSSLREIEMRMRLGS